MQMNNFIRPYNFSPGPACMPVEVLQQIQDEFLNYNGMGISVMELSHRKKEYAEMMEKIEIDTKKLLDIPENYKVFFLQGGATLQFASIPLNLLGKKKTANYLTTGYWTMLAIEEAKRFFEPVDVWPSAKPMWVRYPSVDEWKMDKNGAYFHYCSNETVQGVEMLDFPFEEIPEEMPVVCDMSSSICATEFDMEKYGLVYAHAQKNIGPSGVTLTIVRDDLIGNEWENTPSMCSYKSFANCAHAIYNTPATFSIYACGLNIEYMLKKGVKWYHEETNRKSKLLYDVIDSSQGFYGNRVMKEFRSRINIPFRVQDNDELEKKFIAEAAKDGIIGTEGHRTTQGLRASLYTGMPLEGVEKLAEFMKKFYQENQ